jgi:dTDP-4-amino-4,6-dideoxygalactose transaminase
MENKSISRREFIGFGRPDIGNNEIRAVKKVIQSKWIGSGPVTEKFEEMFRKYKKSKIALSVNSCTAAMHLTLLSLNIGHGDEVITTPMTFCSTINSILLVGAKPVLVDINLDTLNIDEKIIEKKITKKTKAVILVHFGGLPCNLKPIIKICKKNSIKIIEDCAHAIETKYFGKHVGNFGVAGCFSFYATKNLTTGEGGMLITNNQKIANRVKIMRLHGMSKDAWKRHLPDALSQKTKFQHYDVSELGLKYNMIDINSSIGIEQLKKIEKNWRIRKNLYAFYKKKLKNLPLLFQNERPYLVKHGYHLFVIIIDKDKTQKKRDQLIKYLKKYKIAVGINYRCVTDMSYYRKNLKWTKKTSKIAKYVGDNILSLPFDPKLTKKDINYISTIIKKFFDN